MNEVNSDNRADINSPQGPQTQKDSFRDSQKDQTSEKSIKPKRKRGFFDSISAKIVTSLEEFFYM